MNYLTIHFSIPLLSGGRLDPPTVALTSPCCLSSSLQLLQNAYGYVLPIASFVVAWLETWFLDFKVLTQEADDDRGEDP